MYHKCGHFRADFAPLKNLGAAEVTAGERGKSGVDVDQEQNAKREAKKLKIAAAAEKRLLLNEAAAEKKVVKAKERLAKAQVPLNDARARVERLTKDLFEEEAVLRTRQQERAAGPNHQDVDTDETTLAEPQK
jgi:hypothetical protein